MRCWTCGAVLANKEVRFETLIQGSEGRAPVSQKQALDELGVTRECCRRMFLARFSSNNAQLVYDSFPAVKTIPQVQFKTRDGELVSRVVGGFCQTPGPGSAAPTTSLTPTTPMPSMSSTSPSPFASKPSSQSGAVPMDTEDD